MSRISIRRPDTGRRLARLAAVGAAVVLLAACGGNGSAGGSDGPIKVGAVLPLSGSAASIAGQYLAGMTAAIEAANDAGGVKGRTIELVKVDDGFEVPRTIAGVRELAQQERVVAILGPYGTNAAVAAKPIADSVKVPLVGPLAYAEALYDPVSPYLFPLWPSQQLLFQALTEFAIKENGANRIAVMANDGTVGNETIAGTKAAADANGKEVVIELRVPNAQPDYSGVMTQVDNARPDVVVVQADTASMAKMLGDARRVGLTAPFYGGVSAGDQGMAKLAGANANGSFGVVNIDLSGSAPGWSEYTERMSEHSSADPGTSFAASGYVAAQVLLQAIEAVDGDEVDAATVTRALEGNDFDTMAGTVRFTPDNHLGVPYLLLTEVRDAQVTLTGTKLTVKP